MKKAKRELLQAYLNLSEDCKREADRQTMQEFKWFNAYLRLKGEDNEDLL